MPHLAIQHLCAEHEEIRRVLSAFETYLQSPPKRGWLGRAPTARTLTYVEDVLFLRHEEKEEQGVLPLLSHAGLDYNDGVLLHVRQDHERGRYLLDVLKQNLHQRADWTDDDCASFSRTTHEWVLFLREHMKHEEDALFLLLDTLEERALTSLLAQFEKIDREFLDQSDAQGMRADGVAFVGRHSEPPPPVFLPKRSA